MRSRLLVVASLLLCFGVFSAVIAQTLVTTMTLGRDELGLVKTSQGISTKLSFPERIQEIICGDLYDPADGKGNFVIQRSDNDLFLKPVAPIGVSNLFVKTGESGEFTYSLELLVVPASQSHRIVNIVNGHSNKRASSSTTRGAVLPIAVRIDATLGISGAQGALFLPGSVPGVDLLTIPPPPPPDNRESNRAVPVSDSNAHIVTPKLVPRVELQSEAIRREVPAYPESAKQAGVTGEVVVEVVVDERGRVTAATALSGHALLRQTAVTAARGWRFRPYRPTMLDGVLVQAVGTITFVFKSTNTAGDAQSKSNLSDVRKPAKP